MTSDSAGDRSPILRVLRISHSGVVGAWRRRDATLRRDGADLTLLSAARWNEGGRDVALEPGDDDFVFAVRTWGSHPNLFLFDPRPIWKRLRAGPFDVIDIHEEPCSLAAAQILLMRRLLRRSTPVVLYSAQNIYKRFPLPVRWLERRALRTASGAYVCNEAAGRILRRKGFTGVVAVLPLGVDVNRFAPRGHAPGGDHGGQATHAVGEEDGSVLRLGYVGRLEEHKGVQVILDAMTGEPDWRLDVVGAGEHGPELEQAAQDRGLSSRVRFREHVPHDELPEVYRSFDIVVIASLPTARWEEQFCRVAVEALASGVPVVASASGALPEVVGDSGIFFPPGDAEVLRSVLRRLHRDGRQRADLAAQGCVNAKRFSWDEVAAGHRALYDAVVT